MSNKYTIHCNGSADETFTVFFLNLGNTNIPYYWNLFIDICFFIKKKLGNIRKLMKLCEARLMKSFLLLLQHAFSLPQLCHVASTPISFSHTLPMANTWGKGKCWACMAEQGKGKHLWVPMQKPSCQYGSTLRADGQLTFL